MGTQYVDHRRRGLARPAALLDGAIEPMTHEVVLALQRFGDFEEFHSGDSDSSAYV